MLIGFSQPFIINKVPSTNLTISGPNVIKVQLLHIYALSAMRPTSYQYESERKSQL